MLEHLVRLVSDLRPRAVLIENVVGLISMAGGRRYNVEFALLNAAEYGVPQNRRRLFIVAIEAGRAWDWPEPTTSPGDLTLWDAIGDLPPDSEQPGVIASLGSARTVSSYALGLCGGNG